MKTKKKVKVKKSSDLIECRQEKCAYKNKGCKPCEDCRAEPNLVSEKCQRCFDCEYKEGSLRWGNGHKEKEKVLIEVGVKK